MGVAAPVAADDYVGTPPPDAGTVDAGGGSGSGAVAGSQTGSGAAGSETKSHATRSGGSLALTGTDVMGLVFLGAVLIGTGLVLSRRKRSSVR
jgi:LPXTG-motif cell wall-anchored protein